MCLCSNSIFVPLFKQTKKNFQKSEQESQDVSDFLYDSSEKTSKG